MSQARLPVDDLLGDLTAALDDFGAVVLRAEPGAGKTTRVPPAILAKTAAPDRVIVLEPRRVAARAAARRIAEENDWQLGRQVGFQIRLERVAAADTRLLIVTEGILTRMLQDDPFLSGVSAVVFDEFHERSIHTDLALAMTRRVRAEVRPDLRIVVMSATLDTVPVSRFLGGCPVIESAGRQFPVDVVPLERTLEGPLAPGVARAVLRAWSATPGGVLAFLPGAGEIRATRAQLESMAELRGAPIAELYGDMPAADQELALRSPGARRVVLATNVAETSVTVEGISAVVDSGLARVLRFDPSIGLDRLAIERISRASADQRAGRAGRTAPGSCRRLWTAAEHATLRATTEPEIRRIDLSGTVLQLLAWGERDPSEFPWFESPDPASLSRATQLLAQLDAITGAGITPVGRAMAGLPLHPRLARLVIEAHREGHLRAGSTVAAMLTERESPAARPAGELRSSDSDVLDRLHALDERAGRGAASSSGGGRAVLRSAEQIERAARRQLGPEPQATRSEEEALGRALLAAYADRLASRRAPGSPRAVLAGGRGVVLAESSAVRDAPLFLCIAIDAGARGERAEGLVRLASAVQPEWLDPAHLSSSTVTTWDAERERVVAMQRTSWRDLVLSERTGGRVDDADAARILASEAALRLHAALPLDDTDIARLRHRVAFLRRELPDIAIPSFDDESLRSMLPELVFGCRSFQGTRQVPLLDLLRARLGPEGLRRLDRDAPERIEVPSGSRIVLDYGSGGSPVLACRIQELFGLADTPRVASGRVPVVIHLLAPNMRPQQVTTDLRSFWSGAYQDVRKELRARYPRHSWPDDPWNAPPERRPRRR